VSTYYKSFAYDLEKALISLATTFFPAQLSWGSSISINHAQQVNRLKLPCVVYEVPNTTEEVFKTGIYRATVVSLMRLDMDVATQQQIRELSSAITDFLQQTDLETQLTSTGLVVAKLVIPGEGGHIDLGDRYAERTSGVQIIGYSIAGT
jgi:hypothetical protein